MKSVLTGRQGKLYVDIDDAWVLVLCATDVSFEWDHEEILETSRNSGKFIERDTRLCDWGIGLGGLTKVDNADGQASFFWLTQQGIRGSKQLIKLTYTDADSNVVNVTGYVLIKKGALASAVSGFSTATHYFPGTGAYDIDNVTGFTPTDLYKLYLDTTPGTYEVSHADLGGAIEIMLVGREDGMGYKEVSGTPFDKQFKFTDLTSSGKLTFDSTIPFNGGEIVYVQYRK